MTDGRFDPVKYNRLLTSSQAKQSGMLAGLESYYRSEIPRQKLFDQVSSDVYLSDERLWQIFRDRQRQHLIAEDKPPVMLAPVVPGLLRRSFVIDGRVVLTVEWAAP